MSALPKTKYSQTAEEPIKVSKQTVERVKELLSPLEKEVSKLKNIKRLKKQTEAISYNFGDPANWVYQLDVETQTTAVTNSITLTHSNGIPMLKMIAKFKDCTSMTVYENRDHSGVSVVRDELKPDINNVEIDNDELEKIVNRYILMIKPINEQVKHFQGKLKGIEDTELYGLFKSFFSTDPYLFGALDRKKDIMFRALTQELSERSLRIRDSLSNLQKKLAFIRFYSEIPLARSGVRSRIKKLGLMLIPKWIVAIIFDSRYQKNPDINDLHYNWLKARYTACAIWAKYK